MSETAVTLDDALDDAGFQSRAEAAEFFGVDVRTMRRWCDGDAVAPTSIALVLAAMERLEMGPTTFRDWLDGDL